MACSAPISAFQLADGSIVFYEKHRHASVRSLFLPCGRCALCRLERSRQWAVRCVHESKCYEDNCFVTLTYDDRHLPVDRGLRYEDVQKFLRRLRRHFFDRKIRFYMCGEYGEARDAKGEIIPCPCGCGSGALGRPHYHLLLFNLAFKDQLYFKRVGEFSLYTSKLLSQLWPMGNHLIGSMTFESAAYCARYCLDKRHGDDAELHYAILDSSTGEVVGRTPEFSRMSLRPGIGAPWLARFMSDVYPRGEVVSRGKLAKSPRYYDVLFERSGGDLGRLELLRYELAGKTSADQTDERLRDKEQVAVARLSQLNRSL